MHDVSDLIQVEPGDLGYFQTQTEPKGDPIAQGFPEIALTARQGFLLGPNALKSGDFTPMASIVFDDFVAGDFDRQVKDLCKHVRSMFCNGRMSRERRAEGG